MKTLFLFLLFVVATATAAYTDPFQCGSGPYFFAGPTNEPLSQVANKMYSVNGIECRLCEIDCMFVTNPQRIYISTEHNPFVLGTPFKSCPCRYIRYGCLYRNHCINMDTATRPQYEAAIELCAMQGCVWNDFLQNKIATEVNTFAYQVVNYSPGKFLWQSIVKACKPAGMTKDSDVQWPRKDFRRCIDKNGVRISVAGVDCARAFAFRDCERQFYIDDLKANLAKLKSSILARSGQSDWNKISAALQLEYTQERIKAYRTYVSNLLEVPGPFYVYYAYQASFLSVANTPDEATLLTAFNQRIDRLPEAMRRIWGFFHVRHAEVQSLVNQMSRCGLTNGDAVAALVESYIMERTPQPDDWAGSKALDDKYDARYARLLTFFGHSIDVFLSALLYNKDSPYPLLYTGTTNVEFTSATNTTAIRPDYVNYIGRGNTLCPKPEIVYN